MLNDAWKNSFITFIGRKKVSKLINILIRPNFIELGYEPIPNLETK